jgi:hypothetical protein
MNPLERRLARLEARHPLASPWDARDPILAGLSLSELVALVRHVGRVRRGARPIPEQEAVYGMVRERLGVVGIALP